MDFKIALFGSYSGRNKGDLAILVAIAKELLRHHEDKISIFVPTKNPKRLLSTLEDLNLSSVIPIKTSTSYLGFRTLRIIRSADMLIYGGGGLFFDKKPLNLFFNHISNLFIITLINKLLYKKPIYLFSVGASHLQSRIMLRMTEFILSNASYITVRDEHTLKLFRKLSDKDIKLYYDPAFILGQTEKEDNEITKSIKRTNGENKILIVINESLFHPNTSEMICELAKLINQLQENNFVALTYNTTVNKYIDTIYSKCKKENFSLIDPKDMNPKELIEVYGNFDYAICVPMHSAIFAYNAGGNLITIEYDNKVQELNKIIGNQNSLSKFNAEEITRLIDNYHDINWERKKRIIANVKENFKNLYTAIVDL